MRQKLIYTGPLCEVNVDLYITDSWGGEFYAKPDGKNLPRIKVGINTSWRASLSILIHECFEASCFFRGYRYDSSVDGLIACEHYLFVLTHPAFSQVCFDVGIFFEGALPVFAKAYERNRGWRGKC